MKRLGKALMVGVAASTIAVSGMATSANAQGMTYDWAGPYIGAGYSYYFSGDDFLVHWGYNWASGRMVYGVESNFYLGLIPYALEVQGRAGFLVTPRLLAYGSLGYWKLLVGNQDWFEAAVGAEFMLRPRLSLFAEYGLLFDFGGCCDDVLRIGVNFHP